MSWARRGVAAALLVGAMLPVALSVARATESTLRIAQSHYRSAISALSMNPSDPAARRRAVDALKQLKAERKTRKEEIAATFRAEVDAAKGEYDRWKSSELSQAQKNAAAINRDAAIAAAAARREAALKALGPEPTFPGKPAKDGHGTKQPRPRV